MKKLMAALILVSSGLLVGCHTPEVVFTDMTPTPTATISGNQVTVHLGSHNLASACWVHPVSKIQGETVYVYGYLTFNEIRREYVVNLPTSVSSQAVVVIWLNPDGSHILVPLTKP
jgi:hypothetical protein